MRFSEAKGQKVMSTSTATTIGKVEAFVIDPAGQSVVALTLKKTGGDADTLLWSALSAFGRDAVTVAGADALTVADERVALLGDKHHTVLGKRVLTEGGDDLGAVTDVEFDATTGAVTALLTKTAEIAGSRLHSVGSYAVVVRNP